MTQRRVPVKPGWDDLKPRDWAEREAHRIAVEVRRRRKPRSAQWLADRAGELGFPISRTLIGDIEIGRRRYVTTAELVVLAAALETAPIMLVYPPPYSDDVEALPGRTRRKFDAVQDFSGTVEPGVSSPEYAVNVHPLDRARQIVATMRAVLDIYADDELVRARIRLEQLNTGDRW